MVWKNIKSSFKAQMPTRDALERDPLLGKVAHRVLDPDLWHTKRDYVARAVAIGIFWAFIIPIGQMFFAAMHSVLWRANIPISVAITWVTNPFTVGAWLWLAYQIGQPILNILGLGDQPLLLAGLAEDKYGILEKIQNIGLPALTGMTLFALIGPVMGYVGVKLFYRLRAYRYMNQRKNRAK